MNKQVLLLIKLLEDLSFKSEKEKASKIKEIKDILNTDGNLVNEYVPDIYNNYVPIYFIGVRLAPEYYDVFINEHTNLSLYCANYGFTLLHYIAYQCTYFDFKIDYFKKIVKFIKKKVNGKDITLDAQDYGGNTPIHYLVYQNTKQSIARFNCLKENGASLDIPNYKGAIPLHYAVAAGFREIKELVNFNSVYRLDSYNLHPIDYIVFHTYDSCRLNYVTILNRLRDVMHPNNILGVTIGGEVLYEFIKKNLSNPFSVLDQYAMKKPTYKPTFIHP